MHRPKQFAQMASKAEEEENKELKSISAKERMAQRKQAKWTDTLSHREREREGEKVLLNDKMDRKSWKLGRCGSVGRTHRDPEPGSDSVLLVENIPPSKEEQLLVSQQQCEVTLGSEISSSHFLFTFAKMLQTKRLIQNNPEINL